MRKLRYWRIAFVFICLAWAGWGMKVSAPEFSRIHKQYRRIAVRLEPGELKKAALAELTGECLAESTPDEFGKTNDASCSSWRPEIVAARQNVLEQRLQPVRNRARTKVVLFYAGFICIFLMVPPLLLYLCVAGLIRIFSFVSIVKNGDDNG